MSAVSYDRSYVVGNHASPPAIIWLVIAVFTAVNFGAIFVLVADIPEAHLATFADDFFYYVVTVDNFLHTGRSSFDGITLTNGYHPLWFVVLSVIGAIVDMRTQTFFVVIFVIGAALSVAGYVGTRRLLRARLGDCGWAETASALYFFVALSLARTGMEVALVVALMPWFLLYLIRAYDAPERVSAVGLGFFTSLVVLARLDVILFVAGALFLLARRWQRTVGAGGAVRRLAVFGLGGILLPAYFALNLAVFGMMMPVSGTAKGLLNTYGFSTGFMEYLFLRTRNLPSFVFPTASSVVLVAALALLLIPSVRRSVHPMLRLLLGFPVIFHLVTAFRADWPIWPWYYYAVGIAMPAATVLVAGVLTLPMQRLARSWLHPPVLARLDVMFAVLCLLGLSATSGGLSMIRGVTPEPDTFLVGAVNLSDFAEEHPGVYAMGDRAGKTGYLLGRSLIQMEGLVADKKMLERISEEANLIDVLREYRVDYYITTDLRRAPNGCWPAVEPLYAGARAPHMRADLCAEPVYSFAAQRRRIKELFTTRVFRVADLGPGSRPPAAR